MNENENDVPAIDIHGHIGDILYPFGGNLIFKTGIKFPPSSIVQVSDEKNLFRESFPASIINKIFPMISTNCERNRNASATLENFQESLADTNIKFSVCAPIAPNNTYEDVLKASEADRRIIAFTSPDFTWRGVNNQNPMKISNEKLMSDLRGGAMGVKIHPILQEIEADSDEVMRAVEIISTYSKPILLHAGQATYYTPAEGKAKFAEYASIIKIERLISTFPDANFIIGHAGLREIISTIELLPKYKNTYVDTSFQPPEAIKALISSFGSERVLFASDWPYGMRKPAILAAKEACGNDISLQKAILHDNAARLLRL